MVKTVLNTISMRMLPRMLPTLPTLYLKKNNIIYKIKCITNVDKAVTVVYAT